MSFEKVTFYEITTYLCLFWYLSLFFASFALTWTNVCQKPLLTTFLIRWICKTEHILVIIWICDNNRQTSLEQSHLIHRESAAMHVLTCFGRQANLLWLKLSKLWQAFIKVRCLICMKPRYSWGEKLWLAKCSTLTLSLLVCDKRPKLKKNKVLLKHVLKIWIFLISEF